MKLLTKYEFTWYLTINCPLLQIGMDSKGGKMEAVAMFSADGEKVDFHTQVTLEGPVEVRLTDWYYPIRKCE